MKKQTYLVYSQSFWVKGEIDSFSEHQAAQRVVDLLYPKTSTVCDTISIHLKGSQNVKTFRFQLPGRCYEVDDGT